MSKRNWCGTMFDYKAEDLMKLSSPIDGVIYHIFQHEICPTSGRLHLQIYIELYRAQRLSWVLKNIGLCHWEGRKGTREQAREYCKKTDTRNPGTQPTEVGKWRIQGNRTDIGELVENIAPFEDITKLEDKEIVTYAKYCRFFEKVQRIKEQKASRKFRKLSVNVRWGKAGTGKSKAVLQNPDGSPRKDVYKMECNDETLWWDGYNGEKTLVLDDFYGNIRYAHLLNLLDGYQMRLPIKGGFTYAMWDKVYITSNKHPRDWYAKGLTPALARRITNIEEIL